MNIIDNRYKIIKEFNNDNIINTYLVEDIENNNKKYILKKLVVSEISDWKVVELFERESEILKYLDHTGIAKYIEAKHLTGAGEEIFYLVQEYIEGKSLKEFIEKGIPLSEKDIFDITQELLEILDYLSNLVPPIIHRDIKPSNIMIKDDKSVVLIDFGAINNVSSMSNKDITVVGTAGFMAPEQLMGHATIQSDLYSVGTTLINLLTRKNPATLPIVDMKIQFRRETGFNTFFKNFIDDLIQPQTKYRIKTPKKALKYLEKVRNGKFGKDVFAIEKENDEEVIVNDSKSSNKFKLIIAFVIFVLFLGSIGAFWLIQASPQMSPDFIKTEEVELKRSVDRRLQKPKIVEKIVSNESPIKRCIRLYMEKSSYIKTEKDIKILSCTKRGITSLEELKNYPQIEGLYLSDNDITDITPLGYLKNLKRLSIGKNNVSDISVLKELTKLENLTIYHNPITDLSPIKDLNLISFVSFKNNITDFSIFDNFKNLKELTLSFYSISDISFLKNLTKLEKLNLNNNSIKDISILKDMKNLKNLQLSNNKISDISPLKGLTKLKMLMLGRNSISDLSPIKNLKKLRYLSIYSNPVTNFSILDKLNIDKINK